MMTSELTEIKSNSANEHQKVLSWEKDLSQGDINEGRNVLQSQTPE